MRLPAPLLRTLARARPAASPALVDATADVLGLLTHAPITVLPRIERALVVAPHPDDETIGCGGVIAQLTAAGTAVRVLHATDGEATIGSPHRRDETARRRRAEAVAACRRLGAPDPEALGLPDGSLSSHLGALATGIFDVLEGWRPDVAFVPWALERHPDHRAILAAAARLEPSRPPEVWGYEAHTPLHPTHVIPLRDDDVAAKRDALAVHVTAGAAFPLETTLALARWRSLAARGGIGYAEAFHVVDWQAIAQLVRLGEHAWSRPSGRPPAGGRP